MTDVPGVGLDWDEKAVRKYLAYARRNPPITFVDSSISVRMFDLIAGITSQDAIFVNESTSPNRNALGAAAAGGTG